MSLINCPQCLRQVSPQALSCPQCGEPITQQRFFIGYEWKSKFAIKGFPLIHITLGRDQKSGKLLVSKGIIAIGQFGVGVITIAQFGIGLLFGLGQFIVGFTAIAQFALTFYFAIAQFAVGKYVLAQYGWGQFVWSMIEKNSQAMDFFKMMLNR